MVPPPAARLRGRFSDTAWAMAANDAQKTIGIIWLLLIAIGLRLGQRHRRPSGPSFRATRPSAWAPCSRWRIVKTMGQKITKPARGFCAESGVGADAVLRHHARRACRSPPTTPLPAPSAWLH